jgi:hypothetical protein
MGNASLLFWYPHPVVCVFIFRPENQLLEYNASICHLLHVSAIFDYRYFSQQHTWKSIPRWKLSLQS